jgi:hypothetical protein
VHQTCPGDADQKEEKNKIRKQVRNGEYRTPAIQLVTCPDSWLDSVQLKHGFHVDQALPKLTVDSPQEIQRKRELKDKTVYRNHIANSQRPWDDTNYGSDLVSPAVKLACSEGYRDQATAHRS